MKKITFITNHSEIECEEKGIYQIRNIVDNKSYIGSAGISFKIRWRTHKYDLSQKKHHCAHLQNAWNKYTENNFIFEIIYTIPKEKFTKELLFQKEQEFLDNNVNKYNTQYYAQSNLGVRYSNETRDKMSKAKNKGCTYIITSPENIEYKVINLHRFCLENNLKSRSMYRVLTKEHKHHQGWKCRYDYEPSPHIEEKLFFQNKGAGVSKRCLFIDPLGQEYISDSLRSFCIQYNLSDKCMARVASGQRTHHHKWKVKYI